MQDYGLVDGVRFGFLLFFFFFNLWDIGKYKGASSFFTYDMQTGGGTEKGNKTLMHIDEADLVSSLVTDEKSFSLSGRYANTGIQYVNLEVIRVFDEADLNFSTPFFFEYAVNDGIFYEGLKEKRRYLNGIDFLFGKFVDNFKFVSESCFFQFGVAFDDMEFLGNGDEP